MGQLAKLPLLLSMLIPALWAANKGEVIVRGRIVCVDETGAEVRCSPSSERFVILSGGRKYYFSPADEKSQMFRDARVREREIEVRAWLRDKDQLEIIKIYSVLNGKLYDIHYFCPVCNITAYAGGPCWCCQKDFELRETEVP